MRTTLFAAAATAFTLTTPALAETWYPDPTHTDVVITWNHAGFSMQTAKFHEVKGTLEFEPGNIAEAKADFSVVVSSVDTGVEALDKELIGEQFFDAATFPDIRFVSTSVEQTGDMTVRATGDLTVKNVTKPATFEITVHNIGPHPLGEFFDYNKGEWLGMTATTTIKRSEFGVSYLIPIGSDEIEIQINTELRAGGWN
jgi:polyisoprenoid-binding protein YceI